MKKDEFGKKLEQIESKYSEVEATSRAALIVSIIILSVLVGVVVKMLAL